MANPEHLKILQQGVAVWNKWREENPDVEPGLSKADLDGEQLSEANLSRCNLSKASLFSADLHKADLSGANLYKANLSEANLSKSTLLKTDLSDANLSKANLLKADLRRSRIIGTILSDAKLERARIYGISAWDLKKEGLLQKDLIITPLGEPEITVDDLEVAQFIYLMLNNQKIRDVIETITSKAVLILGRFTEDRKKVLDALKDELRLRNYLPIVFDFEPSANRDLTETISLLAKMSRFVVADLTDAKSIPQELSHIIPDTPSVAVLPIILRDQREYAMFEHFRRYPWVLPLHEYTSPEELMTNIIPAIIAPAEQKVAELRRT